MPGSARRFVLLAAGLTTLAAVPAQANAQGTGASWNCRASVAYVTGLGARVEPIVANSAPGNCAADFSGVPPVVIGGGAGDPGGITLRAPAARTETSPPSGETGIASLEIANSDRSFLLEADVVRSRATGRCVSGSTVFEGSSSLAALRINGTDISLDDPLSDLATALAGSPLAGLVTLAINEEIRTGVSSGPGETLIRRALRVRVLPSATGSQLLEAVAGESIVGRSGPVCSGGGGDGGGGGGAIGGSVVTLGEVRGAGPCRRHRYGRQLAIIGSRRGDRISGSNRSDRIFVFAGNDRVSGGRGNDCVEGGNGNDRLDGSTGFDFLLGERGNDSLAGGPGRDRLEGGSGRDRLDGGTGADTMRGGSGNDRLIGGSGNDRLIGGSGNDSIHTGNGRDRVNAGSGNDVINTATAGPPARINCGRGFDVVRINHNERRHIRSCERVFIISLRR